MALIRWTDRPSQFRPFEELERLQQEMNRLFADFGFRTPWQPRVGVFPPLNVSEDAENLFVRAELPGIKSEDLEIVVEGNTLTLRGERKLPPPSANVNYHRRERDSGVFRRIISLNTRVNPEKVEAHFKNGVLTVVLPKAEEAKPKQIAVRAGE
jgi:HSP20 family protein